MTAVASDPTVQELPQFNPSIGEAQERADAARNRQRILCAAQRLFDERGVQQVSMDDVAREAGVGKGTLYRRFGDRASLARSLLSEREGAFQEQLIRGLPPLGPGAPPDERLRAFGLGLMDLLEHHSPLILASEQGLPFAKYRHPVYQAYRLHVDLLLSEHGDPDLDVAVAAELLLAPLKAEVFLYMRDLRGLPLERIKAGWIDVVDRILGTR